MARTSIHTLIPLDRMAQVLGLNPLHFNSIQTENYPYRYPCDDTWFQYDWQDAGRISRENLAFALRQAEDTTWRHLGYPMLPIWYEDEEQIPPQHHRAEMASLTNSRGYPKSITTNNSYVIEVGKRAKDSILLDAFIEYTDTTGDGWKDTATITLNTVVTKVEEIHVYFPGEGGADEWEIRPIKVSLNNGLASITFKREQAVLPELWELQRAPDSTGLTVNGDLDSNFLETVDVYRVYTDQTQQGTLLNPAYCLTCSGAGCGSCGYETQSLCMTIRDKRLGILAYQRANWDAVNQRWVPVAAENYLETRISVNYRAGRLDQRQQNPYVQMDPRFERAIIYYALTLLDNEPMGCENFKQTYNAWSQDLAKSGEGTSYQIAFQDLRSPFGTTKAAVALWRLVKAEQTVNAR
ncbi:MAG TPA: hypothetical protein PKD55_00265 [Bellilinea sp.]|nr:hypothetical protein [Bellilinea sp.]